MFPAVRQVSGPELLPGHGQGGEKLVVQLGEPLGPLFAHIGHIQGVAVLAKGRPVILPGLAVFRQPAVAFEHALGEDDVHLRHRVIHAPQVGEVRGACGAEKVVEIHLVEHPLYKGQANLEGGVPPAQGLVEPGGVLLGNKAFPVKLGDGKVLHPLHTLVAAHAVRAAHILHGDDPGAALQGVVVHHNDPVGPVDLHALHPGAGGEHEPVVGIEFGELAPAQL